MQFTFAERNEQEEPLDHDGDPIKLLSHHFMPSSRQRYHRNRFFMPFTLMTHSSDESGLMESWLFTERMRHESSPFVPKERMYLKENGHSKYKKPLIHQVVQKPEKLN